MTDLDRMVYEGRGQYKQHLAELAAEELGVPVEEVTTAVYEAYWAGFRKGRAVGAEFFRLLDQELDITWEAKRPDTVADAQGRGVKDRMIYPEGTK